MLKKELERIISNKKVPDWQIEHRKKTIKGELSSVSLKAGLRGGKLPKNKTSLRGGDKAKKEVRIEIREVKNPWTSASLSAQWVAQQIEKRMPCRIVLKQVLSKIMANKEAQGAKVEVSGRLNGKEIARREWLKHGRLPLQTIRAIIDYAKAEAYCTYGVIGIKVWIYKGEKFD
jgi:small subunit ribosomal protein S3